MLTENMTGCLGKIGLVYFIFASTLTHNIPWSQCFLFQNIQPPIQSQIFPWNPTKINSPIDSPWSVGWNGWMCGYRICLEHPIRIINRLGNYLFWVHQVARFWGCFLVGGFNPFEKYARQIGSFPQRIVRENKTFLKPPPSKSISYWVEIIT